MVVFECNICRTSLSAEDAQAGQLVRCPKCLSTLRVPAPQREAVGVGAGSGARSTTRFRSAGTVLGSPTHMAAGRRFGFNCGYCSSRLEATENMCGQEGQCPTCGNSIVIPILDRYGRLIDPKTMQVIRQDPHPVHAYAAAGDRAPRIVRLDAGRQAIRCPRCGGTSPITANNCKSCGMPFTMEGTTKEAGGATNGFCVAALVLGIIGIPAYCTVLVPAAAILCGAVGLMQVTRAGGEVGGKGMAIAGILCGALGAAMGLAFVAQRL